MGTECRMSQKEWVRMNPPPLGVMAEARGSDDASDLSHPVRLKRCRART